MRRQQKCPICGSALWAEVRSKKYRVQPCWRCGQFFGAKWLPLVPGVHHRKPIYSEEDEVKIANFLRQLEIFVKTFNGYDRVLNTLLDSSNIPVSGDLQ